MKKNKPYRTTVGEQVKPKNHFETQTIANIKKEMECISSFPIFESIRFFSRFHESFLAKKNFIYTD